VKCNDSPSALASCFRMLAVAQSKILSIRHDNGKQPVIVVDSDPVMNIRLRTRCAIGEIEKRGEYNGIEYYGVWIVWK
jgi:hypothetical protein